MSIIWLFLFSCMFYTTANNFNEYAKQYINCNTTDRSNGGGNIAMGNRFTSGF